MDVQIIQVPYDSGHKEMRAGRGPDHFLQHKLDEILRDHGHEVSLCRIEAGTPFNTEVGTAVELNRLLGERVKQARAEGKFPVVLAGNCNSCLGALAGVDREQAGIVWFDAHGDFNTPETTLSGFFDGMSLAMAAGRCWKPLLGTIPGFGPVPETNIVHIGARDLDPEEEKLMRQSGMALVLPGETIRERVRMAFDELSHRVSRLYLHVDIDVLEAGEARANQFAVSGKGVSVEDIEAVIRMAKDRFEVCAGAIASFAPEYDKEDQVLRAGIRIVEAFVAAEGGAKAASMASPDFPRT